MVFVNVYTLWASDARGRDNVITAIDQDVRDRLEVQLGLPGKATAV